MNIYSNRKKYSECWAERDMTEARNKDCKRDSGIDMDHCTNGWLELEVVQSEIKLPDLTFFLFYKM